MLLKSPLTVVVCVIKREVFSFFACCDESHETLGRTADVFHQFSLCDLQKVRGCSLAEVERYDFLDPKKKRVNNGPKKPTKKLFTKTWNPK